MKNKIPKHNIIHFHAESWDGRMLGCLEIWEEWRKLNFAQFQRQAKKGLYHDNSYSLSGNPSSDYQEIINNLLNG